MERLQQGSWLDIVSTKNTILSLDDLSMSNNLHMVFPTTRFIWLMVVSVVSQHTKGKKHPWV